MSDKVVKNIRIAKYIVVITNILSAILFLYAFIKMKNDILLVPVIINILVALVVWFLFSFYERKYKNN